MKYGTLGKTLLVLLCWLGAMTSWAGEKYAPYVTEEVLRIQGDPEDPVELVVTLFKPKLPGPYPVAVINHGSSGDKVVNAERMGIRLPGMYFLSRGYAVVVPMMRGYGGSEGRTKGAPCNFVERGLFNAKDIMQVVHNLSTRSDLDTDRVVVGGQSYGGWNALSVGMLNPPNVKGIINVAGGMGNGSCKTWRMNMPFAAQIMGAKTSIPSIWFYGDNDSTIQRTIWQEMHMQYTSAQPQPTAELVAFGTFFRDGHFIQNYPEGMDILFPNFDRFLKQIGMPYANLLPDVLPIPIPPATGYADISDTQALPLVNDAGRQKYQRFLEQDWPRAFVIASDGTALSVRGGIDPIGVAMQMCSETRKTCQLYAVDDKVVWKPGKAPHHKMSRWDNPAP
jgi:dienelactone hydrolase